MLVSFTNGKEYFIPLTIIDNKRNTMQANVNTSLSSLQLELLKVYSFNPSNEDLLMVKSLLGRYFASKLIDNVSRQAKEKGITDDDLDAWLDDENQ
jgi:hypothetical protein